MPKLSQTKKIILAVAVVLILSSAFFVLWAKDTMAECKEPINPEDPLCIQAEAVKTPDKLGSFIDNMMGGLVSITFTAMAYMVAGLSNILFFLFSRILWLSGVILNAAFSIESFTTVALVQNGWMITRGLCNLLFALFLLIMAFSTILQIETYAMKKTIWTLVVSALLINFSLVFSGVIIDFAQITTHYFIDAAGGPNHDISQQLMNGLNVSRALDENTAAFNVTNIQQKMGTAASGFLNVIVSLFLGSAVILIAAFVLLAGAIFLIVRVVMLWLLLIFSPLAWASRVMPNLGGFNLWNQWWSNFMKWTFFAPVYAFFIYLAVMAVGTKTLEASFSAASAKILAEPNGIMSGMISGTGQYILSYITIIIILVGGLMVAQKTGVYGAAALKKYGTSAGKWAAKFTGRTAFQTDRTLPWAMNKAGQAAQFLRLNKAGAIMRGQAIGMREKTMGRKENQLYEKYLRSSSPKEILDATKNSRGVNSLLAARVANERGLLARDADTATVKKAMETFETMGSQKELHELKLRRVDALEDPTIREEAIKEATEKGIHRQWSARVFAATNPVKDAAGNVQKDAKGNVITTVVASKIGTEIAESVRNNVSTGEYIATVKGMTKPVKDAFKAAAKENFTDDFDDKDNLSRRRDLAAATDDIAEMYVPAQTLKLGLTMNEQMKSLKTNTAAMNAMRANIQGRSAAQLGAVNMNNKDDWEFIGQYVTAGQLDSIKGELSGTQRKLLRDSAVINNESTAVKELLTRPAWASATMRPPQAQGGTHQNPLSSEKEEQKWAA